jgi:hypothetical protein
MNGQHSSPAAVVTFADEAMQHDGSSTTQQQQQQDGFSDQMRTTFKGWAQQVEDQQPQQQRPQPQQQAQRQPLQQQPSLQDGISPQQHQQQQQQQLPALQVQQQQLVRQGSLSRRQQKKLSKQRANMPATAALVVGISSRHIVGGYSDSTIRLWHMDDVYLADLTEQLATGQIQQSDLALLQEQLMPLGASSYNAHGSFNPFAGLSFGSNVNLTGSALSKYASLDLSMGTSPPLSPTGFAGQIAGQLVTNAFSTASQLLREGSGNLLGVELMKGSEKVKRRGCWCARLRDGTPSRSSSLGPSAAVPAAAGAAAANSSARSSGGGGTVPASPRAAAEAAVDVAAVAAGVSSAAVPKALQCLACGSQDQQLVRALRDFVAIRSVSNNKVCMPGCCRSAFWHTHCCPRSLSCWINGAATCSTAAAACLLHAGLCIVPPCG